MIDLTRHGLKYIEAAINNWGFREDKLKAAWCNDHCFIGKITTERQRRILRIANELDKRKRALLAYRWEFLEKAKEQRLRSGHEHILIECHSVFCRGKSGKAMYRKDYVPGQHICESCGNEMMTREEYKVLRDISFWGI